MAARGRPRAGAKDEIATHEERDLWSKIVTDVKDLMKQSKRIEDLAQDIQDENARLEDLGESRLEVVGKLSSESSGWLMR